MENSRNLILIDCLDQFHRIIEAFKVNNIKTKSNLPLNKNIFEKYIQQKRLFYFDYENSIYFFLDEKTFYTVYYLSNIDNTIRIPSIQKMMVINENRIIKNPEDLQVKESFINDGFKLESTNYYIDIDIVSLSEQIDKQNKEFEQLIQNKNWRIKIVENDFPTEVFDCWRKWLKVTDVPYDHKKEGSIICVYNKVNKLVGVGWYNIVNHTSEWRHVVVNEEYRGQGIGKLILYKWLKIVKDEGVKKGFSWIEKENKNSLLLHTKIGFEIRNKVSFQYIRQ